MRPVIAGLVLSFICHCMLLGLVLYPLCKQADVRRKRIYRFIIRTIVAATVCIIGNYTALVLTHHLSKSSYRSVRVKTVVGLNTLINVFSLVFSFEVWRDILTCTRCSREVTWEELSCDKLSRGGKFSTPCSCFCLIIWVEENVWIFSRYEPKSVKHVAHIICQSLWKHISKPGPFELHNFHLTLKPFSIVWFVFCPCFWEDSIFSFKRRGFDKGSFTNKCYEQML